jgi:hypothetical protein
MVLFSPPWLSVGGKQRDSQARMVGGPVFYSRKGQKRARNGKTLCQRNGSEPCTTVSLLLAHALMAAIIWRKNENGG